jgi:GntR family transcriptional repressor for pyruvate dehydrogenase complex
VDFKEIPEPKKKSSYVAEQILAAIRRGEYKQGDKLPPERTIAQQMNVSRNCVREALSALQIAHILYSRVGAGTYVKNPAGAEVDIGQVIGLAKDSQDLLEIWEAREEIEIALVKLAIDRATSEDLAKIARHLGVMRDAVRAKDTQRYLDANERFHLSIAVSANNLPLKSALQALQGFTNKELLDDVNNGYVIESMEKSLREHEDILSAIRNGDEGGGTKAIRAHFKELEDYFKSKYLGGIKK